MAFASSQAHGTYQPDAFVSYEDGKVLLRIGPRTGSTHLRRTGKAGTRGFISLIKQSLERLSLSAQTTMPLDGRENSLAFPFRKRKLAGQPVEDICRNARACKLMRLACLVLGCLANVMQKRRRIHHVVAHATATFQVQGPHDTRGIHKVADSVTAKYARLLKLLKTPIFPLVDLIFPDGIKPRHRRQPRFVRHRIRVFHTPSPFKPLNCDARQQFRGWYHTSSIPDPRRRDLGLPTMGATMGFFSELKKAASDKPAGESYKVAGIQVTCPHCKGTRFFEQEALLDSRDMSILNIEWAGDSATTLICTRCGHVEWFADDKLIERI